LRELLTIIKYFTCVVHENREICFCWFLYLGKWRFWQFYFMDLRSCEINKHKIVNYYISPPDSIPRSWVTIYSATSCLERFENNNIFFYFHKTL
jgi:hypothetical protein